MNGKPGGPVAPPAAAAPVGDADPDTAAGPVARARDAADTDPRQVRPAAGSTPPSALAWAVVAAGIGAALHVGKLAPAIPALQAELALTLVEAGFLLSLVQGAGMLLGVAWGAVADGLGARRSLVAGLVTLAAASAIGGWAGPAGGPGLLLALRAAEGLGFLMVVLPAPGLIRRHVPPSGVAAMLGVWGAYMPAATALALLLGPACVAALGWRAWWWGLALPAAGMAVVLWRLLPPDATVLPVATGPSPTGGGPPPAPAGAAPQASARSAFGLWRVRMTRTLGSAGPWAVAVSFATYSSQWLAVIGFLPTLVQQAGAGTGAVALASSAVAAANILGNVGAGRLMQRGVAPTVLVRWGFGAMAVTALLAFAGGATPGDGGLPPAWRLGALLGFSGLGGMIPACLFALAVRLAPAPDCLSTTVGWVQQWSSLGQFAGPPVVAWLAHRAGGWHQTGWATGACALAGIGLSLWLARLLRRAVARENAPGADRPGREAPPDPR